MQVLIRLFVFLSIFWVCGSYGEIHPVFAQEDNNSQHLFGNWNGARTYLETRGVDLNLIIANTFFSNVRGGEDHGSATSGNVDLTAQIDTKKAALWDDGTFFIYGLGNYGDEITKSVGNLQVVDNTEAYSTAKLYEFWYEHKFYNGDLGVLVGLHDYNSEFDVLDYAGSLINSSFGISPDISPVGPSIFPSTSLALRMKYLFTDEAYFLTAIYDGVPGDPSNPRGTRIRFRDGDGIFWGNEVGILTEQPFNDNHYKIALGFWYHTAEFENYKNQLSDRNYGGYLIAEKKIWNESTEGQGLGLFFQSGFVPDDRNQIANYYGVGLAYTGLIPERDEDVFSVGFANARNGDDYLDLNEGYLRSESIYEINYRFVVTDYLALQPDLQYVVNPSTDVSLDNANVVGIRCEVAL